MSCSLPCRAVLACGVLVLALAGCDAAESPAPLTATLQSSPAARPTVMTLALGERIGLGRGRVFSFDERLEGRCPIGEVCPWPGEARAWFTVSGAGVTRTVEIPIVGGDPGTLPVGQAAAAYAEPYVIALTRLDPYPGAPSSTGRQPVATVSIQYCLGQCGAE